MLNSYKNKQSRQVYRDNLTAIMIKYIKTIKKIISAVETTRKIPSPNESQTLSVFISPDFDTIKLELEDTEMLVTHWMLIEPDFASLGKQFDVIEYSMPPGLLFNLAKSLPDYAEEMIKHVNRLSYFINGLKLLDMYCCVVEPVIKSSRDTFRIIKYADRCYIRVSFASNAVSHEDIMLEFMGKKQIATEVHEIYDKNKDDWDPEIGLHSNLKKIFEVDCFPEQVEGMASEKDCEICMHYRDQEQCAPLFSCNNVLCDIQFHHSCIVRWWGAQKLSNLFHNVVKGECPKCKTFFELNKSY